MAVYDYTPLYGAGDIIPGTTASIFQNLGLENPNVPVFRLLGSENKGGTNVNESMNFAAIPGQSYRLVNNATGDVLGEASTPEGISALVEQSNAISKQLGKKADLSFETSTPAALGGGYSPIFQDQPNELVGGVLGNVMDIGLPVIGAALGGPIGAGLASAASSAAQERSLKDTLIRAALTAGTTALVPGAPTPSGATVGANLPSWGSMVAPYAANAGTTAAVNAAGSAIAPAIGDIVVTGARNAIPSTLFPAVTGGISNTLLDRVINQPSQPTETPQQPQPEYTAPSDELVVTAKSAAPVNFGPEASFVLPSVGSAVGSAIASTTTPDLSQPAEADQKGFLKKPINEWNFSDWRNAATLASLGVSGIGELFGSGSGGAGTAVPYVSPFGPDGGVGGLPMGQSRQLNPNIADYEKYGFGPEAMFFASQPSSLLAPTTAAPESATVNPKYVPLI